jgi:enamine deaminase RidA (YjgF/YER057c/UK114 family)
MCAGDMRGQIEAAMNNVETVLAAGGLSLANVVRLNFYTTDVDSFVAHYDVIKSRLAAVGCQPSSTLLEESNDWHSPNCSSKSRPLQSE